MMASEREIFSLSGPLYLTVVDWRNTYHRRSIAASLVQSVYILERDRQQNRQGPNALAPPWWEFFHFRLIQVLVDNEDQSYFGAIYESKFPNSHFNPAPKYVIAFRGTIAKKGNRSQDFKLDLGLIRNNLHTSSRFHIGLQAVQSIVRNHGVSDIWLAGHSLGSSIALLLGRDMVKMGIHLETYLFNPPFTSLPIEKIMKNEKLKHGIRFAHSVLTAGLASAVNIHRPKPPHKIDPYSVICVGSLLICESIRSNLCGIHWVFRASGEDGCNRGRGNRTNCDAEFNKKYNWECNRKRSIRTITPTSICFCFY